MPLFLIIFLLIIPSAHAGKITELTADSSPTVDDLIPTVNDPSGAPESRKVTLGNLKTLINTSQASSTINWTSVINSEIQHQGINWTSANLYTGGATGNVGVNTGNPGAQLDVVGTVRATAFSGNGSGLTGVTTSPAGSGTELQYKNGSSFGAISNTETNGTNLSILGNIGIGTSRASIYPLEISTAGNSIAAARVKRRDSNNSSGQHILILQHETDGVPANGFGSMLIMAAQNANNTYTEITNTNHTLSDVTAGSEDGFVFEGIVGAGSMTTRWVKDGSNGYMGFNRTSGAAPGAVVDIYGTGSTTSRAFRVNTNAATADNKFVILDNGNTGIGTNTPSNKLIVASGNVGIGSLFPGVELDVVGSVRISTGTAGQAACFKTDKTIGQCTSVVGAGGGCTCS